ncbi:MAG TPA: diacylglycerol kinase family protein [Streptosporangiaceae bacterium]|nr:diacylglycerol kinase family protein [Streptosporangiaceae bacterium]
MTVSLTLVVNPAAGGGKPARYLPEVTAVLDAAGASYLVSRSTSLEHARTLAAEAAGRGDTVVAFGGDGLTGALAGAIAEAAGGPTPAAGCEGGWQGGRGVAEPSQVPEAEPSQVPKKAASTRRAVTFGIIPAGRGNDFARTMKIPFEPSAAARLLLEGRSQQVDLIAVSGAAGTHAIVAGSVYVGIASVAGEIANRARLIRGPLVYNLAALRALLGWRPTTFRVDTTSADGKKATSEFRGYAVVVANMPYFGAGMKVAPGAHYSDGLLDVVMMRHGPKLTFVRVLMKIKDGSHIALDQVSTDRAAEITMTVDRPMPVGADGELLTVLSPLHIRAMPAALNVIVPH